MVKPGLQSTPNFILFQMISQRCPKLIYSQLICIRLIFGFLANIKGFENPKFLPVHAHICNFPKLHVTS
jgi:hypothetical protein